MAELPHAIGEIRRLRQALEHVIHMLHYAEERINDADDRERIRDARRRAERELAQNALHYTPIADYGEPTP